jgi:hypothetical protein
MHILEKLHFMKCKIKPKKQKRNIRAVVNETENRKTVEKSMKTKKRN